MSTTDQLFARLLQLEERVNRMSPRYGMAFAKVRALDGQHLELEYLSTSIDSPSAPARLASPMAGAGRGAFFRPEVGDEVVVAFEQGDVNCPVILGSLWNDRDQPPSSADTGETNNTRTIVSRAGHQITFDDSASGGIVIKTAGNFEIQISGDQLVIKTTGNIDSSRIILDGVPWKHMHATGTGFTDKPLPMGV